MICHAVVDNPLIAICLMKVPEKPASILWRRKFAPAEKVEFRNNKILCNARRMTTQESRYMIVDKILIDEVIKG